MTGPTRVELAGAAQTAAADGDWPAARTAFEALVEVEPGPEALFGLGDVLWWLGETSSALDYQQRAYVGFRQRGDHTQAAMAAVSLYLTYRVSVGATAVARGWLARLARLVEESGQPPLTGWLALLRAHDSAASAAAERWATQAHETAREIGDIDLELCALSQLGAAVVQQGRLAEGTALLDEAMAAALAGEAQRPHTVVYVVCNMLASCAEWAEFEHALQWIRAADAFEQRYGNTHLHTTCRLYLGATHFASGDWAAAERELRAALDRGTAAEPDLAAEAAARLSELRLAQGRLEEAERLLEGREDLPSCVCVLAWVAIARGDLMHARQLARRLTRPLVEGDPGSAAPYRPGLSGPLAEAAAWETLAVSTQGPEAEAAVRHLEMLAEGTRCAQVQARALAAAGRARDDIRSLESALSLYTRLRLPLAVARTRLTLAGLLNGDEAIAEARAALASFDTLGAARDADAAAARLRELGVTAARGGPTGLGDLTQREREVLALLGEGLTNRELADRLFLSRKTVERHVRNVLFKLGLRNRAEAAAYVVRHGAEIRSTS